MMTRSPPTSLAPLLEGTEGGTTWGCENECGHRGRGCRLKSISILGTQDVGSVINYIRNRTLGSRHGTPLYMKDDYISVIDMRC